MILVGDDHRFAGRFADKTPRIYAGFSSLGALTDYLESHPGELRRSPGDRKFYGTDSMQEALQIARTTWAEGADMARELTDELTTDHAQQKRRNRSVVGGSISVGRLLSGNPKCMNRRARKDGSRVVTLYVGTGNAALVPAKAMIARAAAVAAICETLETNGYACEIVSVTCQNSSLYGAGKTFLQTVVTLKEAGERFNLSDMVFTLGHPSFFRRFVFGVCYSRRDLIEWHSTQGYSGEAFRHDDPLTAKEIFIPELSIDRWRAIQKQNCRDTLEMSRHMLKTFGVQGVEIA